jgi:membrane glycosyltransferase
MLTKGCVRRYGGWPRFTASAAIEVAFSFLQGAISTIRTSIFMFGLLFGKSVTWGVQARDAHRVRWSTAFTVLWPQLVFGVVVCGALLMISPAVFWWTLPLTAGYVLAVPFGVATADPAVGRALVRAGLCSIPEDFEPPAEVRAVREHGGA